MTRRVPRRGKRMTRIIGDVKLELGVYLDRRAQKNRRVFSAELAAAIEALKEQDAQVAE